MCQVCKAIRTSFSNQLSPVLISTYSPSQRRCFPTLYTTARPARRTYLWAVKYIPTNALRGALVAFGVLLAACASPDKPIAEQGPPTPAAAAEMAVMARHDSLMAQTDQLYSLKAQISATHSPAAAPFVRGLLAADAAMMDWMHRYKAPDSTATPAARLAYFEQQQQVLAGVRRQYRATMDSASLFISQHPASSK